MLILWFRLLGCILAFLDVKSTILGKAHYLLYALSTAIQPRMLVTFDEVCKILLCISRARDNLIFYHRTDPNLINSITLLLIGTSSFARKCASWTSCRCCWTSRQTKNYNWISNAYNTSSSIVRRKSRISYRRISTCYTNYGRICDSQEKSRLLEIWNFRISFECSNIVARKFFHLICRYGCI